MTPSNYMFDSIQIDRKNDNNNTNNTRSRRSLNRSKIYLILNRKLCVKATTKNLTICINIID